MSPPNKTAYRKHEWSGGGRSTQRRVKSALLRHHGTTSKIDVWRKIPKQRVQKPPAAPDASGPSGVETKRSTRIRCPPKTYGSVKPITRKEAPFTSTCSSQIPQEPTSDAESSVRVEWPIPEPEPAVEDQVLQCNMSPVKCHYHDCMNTNATRSMFPFPVKDEDLLKLWIQHLGNTELTCLTHEQLKCCFVCEDHFEFKDVLKKNARSRIVRGAVPLKCKGITPECTLVSEPEEDQQCPDLTVLRPNKVYHNYYTGIRAEIAKDCNHFNVSVGGLKCTECERPIHGFQWWCAQCPGARCGACARRMAHRAHHLLRAPAHSTHEQTKAVMTAVRQQLGEDLFVPQAELRHVDENGVDLIVTDEPEVKVEPPELEDDPLVCDPAVDPLACHPKLEDPLALDPLECNPVLQDLTSVTHLEEPSIDYQPEAEPEAQELHQTGKPFKPLGVEFCSPAHPGLASYEMSLAQCSGINDFQWSDGWGDSHSIDEHPIDLDSQSSDDNHWPSVKRTRAPTHYTYTGNDSDDSIKEIDYEQPTHSRTETDTEQNEINRPWVRVLSSQEQNITVSTKKHKTQKRRFQSPTSKGQNILAKQQNVQRKRPWEQVLSNTEQRSTAKKKNRSEQHISEIQKNRRSDDHISDPLSEEQTPTDSEKQKNHKLEQSQIDDIEQISIVSKKRKNHRSEETRVEDSICEEQTSTDSEIQNSDNTLSSTVREQQNSDNRLQSSVIQDSHKEQQSTVTAKRKRKFTVAKKRSSYVRKRTQFPTSDIGADSIDLNVITEPSNTLLNLEDYIRERVFEYPSDIEELM